MLILFMVRPRVLHLDFKADDNTIFVHIGHHKFAQDSNNFNLLRGKNFSMEVMSPQELDTHHAISVHDKYFKYFETSLFLCLFQVGFQ